MKKADNEIVQETEKKTMAALFTVIGACCMLQYFVVGIINLIRGYSIGSYLPFGILLAGYCIYVVLAVKCLKKKRFNSFYSCAGSIVMIYICLISISQGHYIFKAKEYYDNCQYQQALETCEKEAGLWYHLLAYNWHERYAMYMMAESQCQLGDFDSASDIYKLMVERYSGEYYGGRAQERLTKLEKGLEIVAYFPDNLASMPNQDYVSGDPKYAEVYAMYDIALAYRYNVKCDAKAIEVYRKILTKDVSDETKKLAKQEILKLGGR